MIVLTRLKIYASKARAGRRLNYAAKTIPPAVGRPATHARPAALSTRSCACDARAALGRGGLASSERGRNASCAFREFPEIRSSWTVVPSSSAPATAAAAIAHKPHGGRDAQVLDREHASSADIHFLSRARQDLCVCAQQVQE
jgi:hypothetical protein